MPLRQDRFGSDLYFIRTVLLAVCKTEERKGNRPQWPAQVRSMELISEERTGVVLATGFNGWSGMTVKCWLSNEG